MEFFQSLFEFYREGKYLDLKLVSGSDREEVLAHSLVLASAVPGLKDILIDHFVERPDDETILVFPERSGEEVRDIVSEIYLSVIQENEVGEERITAWTDFFSSWCYSVPSVTTKRRYEFRDTKRSSNKRSRPTKKKLKQVTLKNETKPQYVPDLEESDYIDGVDADVEIHELTADAESETDNVRKKIFYSTNKHLEQDSSDDLSDLLRVETTDLDDLSDSDDNEDCETIAPQLITEDFSIEGYRTLHNLNELAETFFNENSSHFGSYIIAEALGVHLRDGIKPYMPLKSHTRVQRNREVQVIPDAPFVGLCAVGVRDGVNIARPIVTRSDLMTTDLICQNFVSVIRHLTGGSVRDVVESHRHKSFKNLDKGSRIQFFDDHYKQFTESEKELALQANVKFHSEQDNVMSKLKSPTFPEDIFLKMKLVNEELRQENVSDYVLIYGDSLNSLKVQSFFKLSKLSTAAAVAVLVDALAAFCGLRSASELYSVPYFKGLVDDNFDKLCERTLLSSPGTLTTSLDGGSRPTVFCPICSKRFAHGNSVEKRRFELHKLVHEGCECKMSFATDEEFFAHMKTVHNHLKPFKCTHGKCNKRFFRQRTLERHISRVHDRSLQDGVGVVCDICGEVYLNRFFLQRHHYLAHKSRPCPGCKVIIHGGSIGMYNHRAKECTQTMEHLCPKCGQGFKMKITLANHIRLVHIDEKDKCSCEICGRKFASKQRLHVHVTGVHNSEKTYSCRAGDDVCNAKFSTQASRKRHEKKQHNLDIRLKRGGPKKSMVTSLKQASQEVSLDLI